MGATLFFSSVFAEKMVSNGGREQWLHVKLTSATEMVLMYIYVYGRQS
jgi:uncharacterized membrane protein